MKYKVTSYNTKKMLAQSLKKAMEKKPFSKITVREIIEDCGVNRKTFYYHFEDIYALLKWMFEEEAIEVVKGFDLLVDYREAIIFIMNYIEENNHIINCAVDSIGRDGLKQFLRSDFIEVTSKFIQSAEYLHGVTLDEGYRSFITDFYAESLASMLIQWIQKRNHYDREIYIQYLSDTIHYSLQGILEAQKAKNVTDRPS